MDPTWGQLLVLSAAVAAGAAVQAATGFGFAIIAAPVFLAVLNSTAAVPLLVALHVVQCTLIVPRVWAGVPWRQLGRLGAGAAIGCPLGLALFHLLDVRQLKLGVGIVILVVAALLALRRRMAARVSPGSGPVDEQPAATTVLTGFLSGALTSVLVMPGPPLMVHLLRHPLPAEAARALSITFFAGCYVAVLIAHVWLGSFGGPSLVTTGWLALPVLLGTLAGMRAAPWLADRHLALVLAALLVLAGLGAIASAL